MITKLASILFAYLNCALKLLFEIFVSTTYPILLNLSTYFAMLKYVLSSVKKYTSTLFFILLSSPYYFIRIISLSIPIPNPTAGVFAPPIIDTKESYLPPPPTARSKSFDTYSYTVLL